MDNKPPESRNIKLVPKKGEHNEAAKKMQNGFAPLVVNVQGTISPRRVYVINEGTMPAVPENLISYVKISPTFTKVKSRSLQDRFPSVSTSPNEYLMWKLKEEKYLEDPIRWLIEKRIIPVPAYCRNHQGISIRQEESNISWRCGSCRLVHPVLLPALYRSFENLPISDLLAVTIHWACQSDLSSIMSDCSIDVDDIFQVWSRLQVICTNSLRKSKKRPYSARNNRGVLEGAVFQLGEFLIIGVLERHTRFTHLDAVPFENGWNIDKLSCIIESMLKACTVFSFFVSDCILFKNAVEKFNLQFVLPDPDILDPRNPGYHNLNIRHYMIRFLVTNFSMFDSKTIHRPVLQAYLDELQWRERFGHTAQMAFWNMLYRIAREIAEKSDTMPKCIDDELDMILKPEFDKKFPHQMYEPPFPLAMTEKEQESSELNSLEGNGEAASKQSLSAGKNAEDVLPSCGMEIGEETLASKSSVDDVVNSSVVIEDETVDAFCVMPGGKTESGSASKDITGFVSFLSEGIITLTISNLLSIQTWPFILNLKGYQPSSEEVTEKHVAKFRKRLSEQGYFHRPIPWLVKHHLVKENVPCAVCGGDQFNLHEDRTLIAPDKIVWKCAVCTNQRPLNRLKFFTLFGFSLADILHLMFHWVAQSKLEDVCSQISLNEYKIRYVYWAIQRVCSRVMELQNPTLGGDDHIVEVGIVQFGQYCIIGAIDRETTLTRFKTIPAPKIYTSSLIESVIVQWLKPCSVVVTSYHRCLTFDGNGLTQYTGRDIVINSSLISRCLYLLVKHLFGKFSTSGLKLEMIQSFLDEIQWRERYGIVPEAAFWSLFYQIAQDDNIDLNARRNGGIPQTSEVGSISHEVFGEPLDNYIHYDTKNTIEDSTEKSTLPPPQEENPVVIGASVSPPSELLHELPATEAAKCSGGNKGLATVDVVNNSAASVNGSAAAVNGSTKVVNEPPFPGVTLMSEEELNAVCNEEVEVHEEQEISVEDFMNLGSSTDIWDDYALTVEWSSLKTLRPVFYDCMATHKNKKKDQSVPQEKSQKYVALDEYYFARKKPSKNLTPERKTYVFCCTICKLYIFSNISVIEHTTVHAQEKRKDTFHERDVVNCPDCLLEISSTEALEDHVKSVHKSGSSLTCIICSHLFPSVDQLIDHMKYCHVPSEMPYSCSLCRFRSSVHKEVIDHFNEVHESEPHLICPFCLKICSPRAKTDEVLYTLTYCQHVIKHYLGKNSSCPSCRLVFLSPNDVKHHFLKDHISFQNQSGVVPFKPRQNPIIVTTLRQPNENTSSAQSSAQPTNTAENEHSLTSVMLSPHPLSSLVPQNALAHLIPSSSTLFQNTVLSQSESVATGNIASQQPPSVSSSSSFANDDKEREMVNDFIKYNITAEQQCFECGGQVGKNHFYKLLSCYCKFSTHCACAFVDHMSQRHGVRKKYVKHAMHPKEVHLQNVCACSCGFSSNNGDLLANHVYKCHGQISSKDWSILPNKKQELDSQMCQSLVATSSVAGIVAPQNFGMNKMAVTAANQIVPGSLPVNSSGTVWFNGPLSGFTSASFPMPINSELPPYPHGGSILLRPVSLDLPPGSQALAVHDPLVPQLGPVRAGIPLNQQMNYMNDPNLMNYDPRFRPYFIPIRPGPIRTDSVCGTVPSVPNSSTSVPQRLHSENFSSQALATPNVEPSHVHPSRAVEGSSAGSSTDSSFLSNIRIENVTGSNS